MSYDDEAAVCGGLICEPETALPYAWATLCAEDFEDEGQRWLFEVMVQWWHERGGDVAHPDLPSQLRVYALLALGYTKRFDLPEAIGLVWLEGLEAAYLGELVHRWHVDRLANAGAVRRIRTKLYEWSQFICALEWCDAQGEPMGFTLKLAFDDDDAGRAATKRTIRMFMDAGYSWRGHDVEYPDARRAIAAMLREIRRELRRAPSAPPYAGEKVARFEADVPEVGVW